MADIEGTSLVWLPDPTRVWVQGEVVGTQAHDELRVRRVCDGEVVTVAASKTVPKNPACEEGGHDLAALSHLDEANEESAPNPPTHEVSTSTNIFFSICRGPKWQDTNK